jgi:2,3-bisphosphoglycerate-dependent phosphoglycerate mutase
VSARAGRYRQVRFTAPPGSAALLLIRHGESEEADLDRPFPLVDGHGDPSLAPLGRAQADALGARLAGEHVDAVVVTTLRRTVETAAPLAARLGLVPIVEPDLREVHLGEWEGGAYRQKVIDGDPVARTMVERQRWDVIPGAEPNEVVAARVRGAVERIAAAHPARRVAVFTHGGIIGTVLALASGSAPFAFVGADNGSISEIVVAGGSWVIRRFNDTAHLGAAEGAPPPA